MLLLLLLPLFMYAQGVPPVVPGEDFPEDLFEETEGTEFGMGGSVGSITHNGITYSQVRLMPEISFGKFGIGLDIDLLIDANGNVREEDWDEWQDYVNKIFFIRWGNRQDPFYFKVGCFPNYSLGHGMIFANYSNMTRYPDVKNVGAYVGANFPISGIGVEAFTHNVHKNEILAARVHANPFWFTGIPVLEDLKLGLNMGMDRNQYARFPDSDGDGVPDIYDKFPNDKDFWLDTDGDGIPDDVDFDINGTGLIDHPSINPHVGATFPNITDGADPAMFNYHVVQDSVTIYLDKRDIVIGSVDYNLPLVDTEAFSLDHYAEYAMIKDYGTGIIFPGFSAKVFIFEAKLEMRNFKDEFIPGFFDRLYDEQRSNVTVNYAQDGDKTYKIYGLRAKDELLQSATASMGWFGFLKANIFNIGAIKGAYQDMYSENRGLGKSLWTAVTLNPAAIPKLKEAGLYYSQVHTPYVDFIHLRNEAAALSGRLIYAISENADLVGRYSETYRDINGDGKIKGKDEIISSLAFGVQFQF